MTNSVTLNGNTYTDDASPTTGMANGGHRTRFIPALSDFVADATAKINACATYVATALGYSNAAGTSATASAASASAAAGSAASALAAPGTAATSTTSLTVGTVPVTLTIQTGKSIVPGMTVKVAYTTDPTIWMLGDVTSYNSGTGVLGFNSTMKRGSGTYAAWTVSISGPAGTTDWGGVTSKPTSLSGYGILDAPIVVTPADDGTFTVPEGAADKQFLSVHEYGVYRFDASSTAAADGETVLAPASGSGRWTLVAPSWDFVWAYLSGVIDDLQNQLDAKTLKATATLDFPSITGGSYATLVITVFGAVTTDPVIVTAPSSLPAGIVARAYVSAADVVTVRLDNLTAGAIDPAANPFIVSVFK